MKNWLLKQKNKALLLKAMNLSEFYLEIKTKEGTKKVFSKILYAHENEKSISFGLHVPSGLNPKDLKKKEYILQQVFQSPYVKIKDDISKLTVKIFKNPFPEEYKYKFQEIYPVIKKMDLPIVAGLNIEGELVAYDMADNFSHLLLAGETGSGKSSSLRVILTSIIQLKKPEELELYLYDLKRSEFGLFQDVSHVKEVLFEPEEIELSLMNIDQEIKRRGDLLNQYKKPHIKELTNKLPILLICIDEVAILKKEKTSMEIIERISSVGRALGIFLILSGQRFDRQVLDGKLKNNLLVRFGFRHSDRINSAITNIPGAENIKMEHRGRMLMKMDDIQEIQSPHLLYRESEDILIPYLEDKRVKTAQKNACKEQEERPQIPFGEIK